MPEVQPVPASEQGSEQGQEKTFTDLTEFRQEIARLKQTETIAEEKTKAGEKVVWTAHFENVDPDDLIDEDMEAYNKIMNCEGNSEDVKWLNDEYKKSVYQRDAENDDSRDYYAAWLANVLQIKMNKR